MVANGLILPAGRCLFDVVADFPKRLAKRLGAVNSQMATDGLGLSASIAEPTVYATLRIATGGVSPMSQNTPVIMRKPSRIKGASTCSLGACCEHDA
jgi:hypothetical protein